MSTSAATSSPSSASSSVNLPATVKWFDKAKGFGFLRPDDGSADIFVHATGLMDPSAPPTAGDVVTYDAVPEKRGLRAVNVRVLRAR